MRNAAVTEQLQRLRSILDRVREASNGDMDLQGHWARYVCILVSGFVENSIKEVFSDYVKACANDAVARYAMSQLNKLQNPKTDKVLEVTGAFKSEWKAALDGFVSEDGRKEAIDSIMNNRNQIAHGRNVGITLAQVDKYLGKIVSVVQFIETQCVGGRA